MHDGRFSRQYRAALLDYLLGSGELGRERAYELGRRAVDLEIGLLPLALGIGTGAEIQAALARVVIGGLLASTLVTLVLIPVTWATVHEARERMAVRIRAWRERRAAASGVPSEAG